MTHRQAHLLLLPQELRDDILPRLFNISSTIVVEDCKANGPIGFKLLQPLPVNILRTNKKLHADAKLELQKYVQNTRLVFNCCFPVFQEFIHSLPDYIKEHIKRIYLAGNSSSHINNMPNWRGTFLYGGRNPVKKLGLPSVRTSLQISRPWKNLQYIHRQPYPFIARKSPWKFVTSSKWTKFGKCTLCTETLSTLLETTVKI